MSEADLQCPICYNNFDLSHRLPLVLTCGHSFCKICIQKLKQKPIRCPIDRKFDKRQLNNIPRNYILLDLLTEAELETPAADLEFCVIHPLKKSKYYCTQDEVKICSRCILQHQQHDILEIIDYEHEVALKRQRVSHKSVEPSEQIRRRSGSNRNNRRRSAGRFVRRDSQQRLDLRSVRREQINEYGRPPRNRSPRVDRIINRNDINRIRRIF